MAEDDSLKTTLAKIEHLNKEIDELSRLQDMKREQISSLSEKLPSNKDLLFFHGDGCSFTKRVEPSVRCVESFLGQKLTR